MAERSAHPDVVDLAEYAEGLLDATRQADVQRHVRGCPDCSTVLSDLAGLPQTLAAAPLPPLPDDVAERLDRAIAAESRARASGWSGTAQTTPLRRKRRWLAPVAAAAVVVGAIAVAVPAVLDDSGSDDAATEVTTGSEDAGAAGESEENAIERQDRFGAAAPNAKAGPAELTSVSFGRDVVDNFYTGSRDLRLSVRPRNLASAPTSDGYYAGELDVLPDPCDAKSVPDGRIDDIRYDGEPARLLRKEAGKAVDAIAFSCAGGDPILLDAVTLRPRR